MNKQDNLRDNIYLILGRIKLVRDTLLLDTEPGYFLEKTLDDVNFIHQILGKFLDKLQENKRLIEREELFNLLSDLEWQFSQVLSDILNGSGSISASKTPELRDHVMILRKNSLDRRETIETIAEADAGIPKEPVMSTHELNELLKDF